MDGSETSHTSMTSSEATQFSSDTKSKGDAKIANLDETSSESDNHTQSIERRTSERHANAAINIAGSVGSYKHFAPRIDSVLYQAEVPEFTDIDELEERDEDEALLANGDWYHSAKHVSSCSPANASSIKEFLKVTRNIFECVSFKGSDYWTSLKISNKGCSLDIPMESDENAIEYLSQFNYDVELATFNLFNALGAGKDGVSTGSTLSSVEKSSNGIAFGDNKDRLFKNNKTMHGSFTSTNVTKMSNDEGDNARHLRHVYTGVILPVNDLLPASEIQNTTETIPDNQNVTLSAAGRTVRSVDKDKQESKKKWFNLYDKGTSYRRSGFAIDDAQAILDEAATLGPYVPTPGDDLGDKLKVFLGELVKDVAASRNWIADMRDKLVQKKEGHAQELRKFLSSSRSLRIVPSKDISILQKLLEEADEMSAIAKKYLKLFPKPTLQNLSDLLNRMKIHPVYIPEFETLVSSYNIALSALSKIDGLLITKDVCANLKPSTMTKAKDVLANKTKMKLLDAQDLLRYVQNLDVIIPKQDKLAEVIAIGLSWQQEVISLTESTKAVSMRRVDTLLGMVDNLPFNFTAETEKLREKKTQAKLWLDKMKKSFSIKAAESNRRRSNVDVEVSQGDNDRRIGLEDMKLMVEEGQLLLESEDSEQTNGSKSHTRELQKAQSIVEMADNWLEKVRDMLKSENSLANIQAEGDKTSCGNVEMGRFLDELREMLREADQMPVVMDEMLVLRVQVQALDWSSKMRPILQNSSNIRLQDLQKHYRDICKIRNSLPEGVADEYPACKQMLPEELTCKSIIDAAEAWLDQMKKITQNNAIRRGVPLDKVLSALYNSRSVSVNIESEMRPLRTAITSTINWLKRHFTFLQRMGAIPEIDSPTSGIKNLLNNDVVMTFLKLISNENNEPKQDEGQSQDGENENMETDIQNQDSVQKENSEPAVPAPNEFVDVNERVTYAQLNYVVSSGAGLQIDFDEVISARELLKRVENWQSQVEEALSSSFLGNVSRSSRSKGSKSKRPAIEIHNGNLSQVLESLLAQANDIVVNLDSDKQRIASVLAHSRQWDSEATSKLEDLSVQETSDLIIQSMNNLFSLNSQAITTYPFLRSILKEISIDTENPPATQANSEQQQVLTKKGVIAEDMLEDLVDGLFEISDELSKLLEQAEIKGLVGSSKSLLVRCCVSCIQWSFSVRDFLKVETERGSKRKGLWGDIDQFVAEELGRVINSHSELFEFDSSIIGSSILESLENMRDATNASIAHLSLLSSRKLTLKSGNNQDEDGDISIDQTASEPNKISAKKGSRSSKQDDAPSAVNKKSRPPIISKASQRIKEKTDDVDIPDSKATKDGDVDEDDEGVDSLPKAVVTNIRNLNTYLNSLRDTVNQHEAGEPNSSQLPIGIKLLVTLWKELLDIFNLRRKEVQLWIERKQKIVSRSLTAVTGSSGKQCQDDIKIVLDIANQRGLECEEITSLRNLLSSAATWQRTAQGMLQREPEYPLLTLEDLKGFIKSGEQLVFDPPELALLRAEQRRGKLWMTKVERFGDKILQADDQEINTLVSEAATISIDFTETLQLITEAKLRYCLCRQLYHSDMVGCDSCKEWYHCACIGISKSAADKLDSYSCIRCSLVSSFENTAVNAALTVNRWMIPENVARWRDQVVAKIQKRVIKEGKEVNRLENQLYEALKVTQHQQQHVAWQGQNGPRPGDSASIDSHFLEMISSGNTSSSFELPDHIARIKGELEEAKRRLARSRNEESEANKRRLLEDHMTEDCQDWMVVLQRILWPSNKEESLAGQPIGLSNFTPSSQSSFLFYPVSSNDDHILKTMVPEAIRRAAEAAVALNIDKVDDVVEMVECFRWMSWCNLTLHAIRAPLSTRGLHKLLESGRSMRFADEKIFKLLQHINGKAAHWKAKARKSISSRSLDLNKLTELVLEGNGIPINSRLKVDLKEQLKRYQDNTRRQSGEATSSTDEVVTGRRNSAGINRAISYTGFISIPVSAPDSSDDESQVAHAAESHQVKGTYEEFLQMNMAVEPKELWPVKLPMVAVPRVSIRNSGNPVNSATQQRLRETLAATTSLNPVTPASIVNPRPPMFNMQKPAPVSATYVPTKASGLAPRGPVAAPQSGVWKAPPVTSSHSAQSEASKSQIKRPAPAVDPSTQSAASGVKPQGEGEPASKKLKPTAGNSDIISYDVAQLFPNSAEKMANINANV